MRSEASVAFSALLSVGFLVVLSFPFAGRPSVGSLADPWNGLYRAARQTPYPPASGIEISGLDSTVQVFRDHRGVPHIFASSDRDAVTAMGYVTAQDRLFQMDFLPRVAAGRLSEVVGPEAIRTDRFMRSIGMDWGAGKNAKRIAKENGTEQRVVDWYCSGVNAYIATLRAQDLPLEFRLLGYRPEACSLMQVARVLQFMSYDLTFRTDDARYGILRDELDPDDYADLFPEHATINEPIVPRERLPVARSVAPSLAAAANGIPDVVDRLLADHDAAKAYTGFGYEHGKGSNNWAVAGSRSVSGLPVLAGDMHLRVSLPSLWYEVHLVTPTMNVYGVTVPGAPLPIEAINDHLAWAFTNTGSDQIDHVALELGSSADEYLVDGKPRPFTKVPDTILVRGEDPVVDTLLYAEWGPVRREKQGALAIRWVAHDSSRTLRALWGMIHATDINEFDAGLRFWDSPMQNILFADVDGNIAIRSTGTLPIRRDGEGPGLLDGTKAGPVWTGRVPFEELPYARNPAQGYLASANQEPVGSTYPYYMGHDWRRSYRGIRINQLLRQKPRHSVEDLKRYQADVLAIHAVDFVRFLDTTSCDTEAAEGLRRQLLAWDGSTTTDSKVTLLFDEWIEAMRALVWDEAPFRLLKPYTAQLYHLLDGTIDAKWADRHATPTQESVRDVICESLALAQDARSGYEETEWGLNHEIVFSHLLGPGMAALSRGPFPFPGYSETLSPGNGRLVTHTASWRVVVDLSTRPPTGFGVFAGGQSGNPLYDLYDLQVETFLDFEYYPLENSSDVARLASDSTVTKLLLSPGAL